MTPKQPSVDCNGKDPEVMEKTTQSA